jgi:hypothetical protein
MLPLDIRKQDLLLSITHTVALAELKATRVITTAGCLWFLKRQNAILSTELA